MTELHSLALEKPASKDLQHPEDSNAKLLREYSLLKDGISSGFMARAEQAKDHPGLTSLEIVGSAAIGAGLTWMSEMGGRPAAIAKAGGLVLTAVAGADAIRRVAPSIGAMSETWESGSNFEANKNTIATNLGSALFDYPLMGAAGRVGSYGATAGREFLANKIQESFLQTASSLLHSPVPFTEQSWAAKFNTPEMSAIRAARPTVDQVFANKSTGYENAFYDPKARVVNYGHDSTFDTSLLFESTVTRNFYPIIPLPTSGLLERLQKKNY